MASTYRRLYSLYCKPVHILNMLLRIVLCLPACWSAEIRLHREGVQLECHHTVELYPNHCCRHARDGSVISMFGTSAYQYNPRHSAAPSEMPRGIKSEHNSDTTVAAVPQTDDLVKLGKRKAWAKFLAYEVSATLIHLYFIRMNEMCLRRVPAFPNN